MSRVLPILFNTEMVKAILDGRKTVTRRVVKPKPQGYFEVNDGNLTYIYDTSLGQGKIFPPYQIGDILYVRETWNHYNYDNLNTGEHREGYFYKASPELKSTLPDYVQHHWGEKWRPSIHMPKEAARIWLKVTDVRVERLQDITSLQCVEEGVEETSLLEAGGEFVRGMFHDIWNSTIKKSALDRYGWEANPWVFVYEFERIDKPC